jgi:hypothetical protein
MFLQVVVDAGDIRSYFRPIGQPNTGYFTQRRVRLFGRLRPDNQANTASLGTSGYIGNPLFAFISSPVAN